LFDKEKEFFTMRQHLFVQPTHCEAQTIRRAATANIDNDEPMDETDSKKAADTNEDSSNRLIVHSTYEKRLEDIKRDIHEIWSITFNNTTVVNTKLIVGARNSRSSKLKFVRTSPDPSLLTLKKKKGIHLNSSSLPFYAHFALNIFFLSSIETSGSLSQTTS
jgi:hypothetical protein